MNYFLKLFEPISFAEHFSQRRAVQSHFGTICGIGMTKLFDQMMIAAIQLHFGTIFGIFCLVFGHLIQKKRINLKRVCH